MYKKFFTVFYNGALHGVGFCFQDTVYVNGVICNVCWYSLPIRTHMWPWEESYYAILTIACAIGTFLGK